MAPFLCAEKISMTKRLAFTLVFIPVLFTQSKLKSHPGSSLNGANRGLIPRSFPLPR
jgi:hypothetical protein